MLKVARVVAPVLFSLLAACASSSSKGSSGAAGGDGDDKGLGGNGEGSAASAPDTNPYGVPYPTDNLGTNARQGKTPGNKIPNYKFMGYPDGDMSKGLQPVSLANFYDPEARKFKLLHISASGTWCVYCREEVETVAPMKAKLDQRKVAWLISFAEGASPGTPATKEDFDKWLKNFTPPYTHVWDPGNKNFGPFYDAAALPWNANLNAKTMEILESGVGAQGYQTEAEVLKTVDNWLTQIDNGTIK